MQLRSTSLIDKYNINESAVFLTGIQALVRLCLVQQKIDAIAGLNTAGYVTGYRGSPLGAVDQQFLSANKFLKDSNIIYEPAINEDLAATAIWGAQQSEMRGDGVYDGVFCIWYGKGPGVDRSGDALKHGNLAGSSKHGGVLVLLGDDHTCESSTTCHQSEYALVDSMIPILNPANVKEIIEFGLHGWALSRFSGVWAGLKCVKDNVESSMSINFNLNQFKTIVPDKSLQPPDGVNIRPFDNPHDQEARMHQYKLNSVLSYSRKNNLDKVVFSGGNNPRFGIVSTGKSFMDTLQALEMLGIDEKNLFVSDTTKSSYHPGRSGSINLKSDKGPHLAYFGELHPAILKKMDFKDRNIFGFEIFLKNIPKPNKKARQTKVNYTVSDFQKSERDFAFVIDKSFKVGLLEKLIKEVDVNIIQKVVTFDVFEGENIPKDKKSVAINVTLQALDKTLSEKDLDQVSQKIIEVVKEKTGATIRS